MEQRHRLALQILSSALGLGILGDILFKDAGWGINIGIWFLFVAVVGAWLALRGGLEVKTSTAWLLLPALAYPAGFALFDSPGVALLCTVGTALTWIVLSTNLRERDVRELSLFEATIGAAVQGMVMMVDPIVMLIEDIEWKLLGQARFAAKSAPYVRGGLIAFPFLLVFGLLFARADAVFGKFLTESFTLDAGNMFSHGFLMFFFTGFGLTFLRRAFLGKPLVFGVGDSKPSKAGQGSTETLIVVGSLNLLFATFVASQLRTYFGGAAFVQQATGLNYSDYARQGFYELVTVSALALPILLAASHFMKDSAQKALAFFKGNAVLMVGLLIVIMTSALLRMGLYVSVSGLSELRLFATALMGWLAIVFMIFVATVLRGRSKGFAFASLVAGLGVFGTLVASNPGRTIAEHNVSLLSKGQPLDTEYLKTLGGDAVPSLVKALPLLKGNQQRELASWLRSDWGNNRSDWRSSNLSRGAAHSAVMKDMPRIVALAGPTSQIKTVSLDD